MATAVTAHSVATCNGRTNYETVNLSIAYTTAGIFGWKKRLLYILLILLTSVVVINMILTFWIIKILDLSSEGVGKMSITPDGIQIDSEVEFLDALSAKEILSRENQPLKLESSRNVTLFAKDKRNRISNMLSLGEAGFRAIGNYFSVRGKSGEVLFHVDPNEMVVSADHLTVTESGGLRLAGFLQTGLVRGSATKDLRLDSPLKKVVVSSDGNLNIESPAGGINSYCLKNMKLQSTGGSVAIDGSRLEMKNLRSSWSFSRDRNSEAVYQVCMCENGRIFLAHRDGHCQIQESVCREDRKRKAESSWTKSMKS